ncbi:MAG: DUF2442 domain-containing protein [Streptosporangiaceae bacterium]
MGESPGRGDPGELGTCQEERVSDGTVGDVDLSAEHWTGVLEPLNDPEYFAQVTVDAEAGTVAWPNGIDLAPEPLYEQAHAHPLAAA